MSETMKKPAISVVMAAYNAEKHIGEAIQSILDQTFADFEFIIINDGSTDKTLDIIESFQKMDPRIVLINNTSNKGLPYSLNRGIKVARGQYIARMDADDYSLPHRFLTQSRFLENHPSIDLAGSYISQITDGHKVVIKYPTSDEYIKVSLLRKNPIAHPSVMGKATVFKNNLYDESFFRCQDYELWVRLLNICKYENIPIPLLKYRQSNNVRKNDPVYLNSLKNVRVKIIEKLKLNWEYSIFDSYLSNISSSNIMPLKQFSSYTKKVIYSNIVTGVFPIIPLTKFLIDVTYRKYADQYKSKCFFYLFKEFVL